MSAQLSGDADWLVTGSQIVHRADIVKATAGNVISRGRVCACHDPVAPQGNCMNLVGRECVPDDEFAILRGAHDVSVVAGPGETVYLGQMPLECAPCLKTQFVDGGNGVGNLFQGCVVGGFAVLFDLFLQHRGISPSLVDLFLNAGHSFFVCLSVFLCLGFLLLVFFSLVFQ